MADERDDQAAWGDFTFFRERRECLGLSVEEVAEAIGMDAGRYARCEADPRPLNLDDVIDLESVLDFRAPGLRPCPGPLPWAGH